MVVSWRGANQGTAMDDSFLDALARRLGTQANRRGAAKSALGALALGLTGRSVRRDVAAQTQPGAPPACHADQDCARLAVGACDSARCVNGGCTVVHVDCIDGYVCCSGACCAGSSPSGNPSGSSSPSSHAASSCQTDADCPALAGDACLTQRCGAGGCVPAPVACPDGQICRDGGCRPV